MPQSNDRPEQALRRLSVALDATALRGPRTGVGEFCLRLLEELAHRPDLDVGAFALSRSGRGGIAGLLPSGVRALGWPGPGLPGRALNASWRRWPVPPGDMWGRGADVVHGTNYVVPPARASALVVTVHDLSALRFPEWCRPAARAYPDLVKKAVDRGAWVHADSTFVAREVTELLGVPATRVRAVHLGVSPPSAAGPAARALPDWVTSYILAVGTVEPRKGFPLLVDAFGRLAGGHPGLALVIAGSSGWGSADLDRAVAACPAGERVLRLGWVDDQQRDALTAAATVFAYPSRYEGFGLPPLQAMAAGTPVVASDCGALAEVLGDAALLVPAGDADSLAGALGRLLDDAGARSQLSQRGIGRAATFTWELCATGMVALYREAAAAHR